MTASFGTQALSDLHCPRLAGALDRLGDIIVSMTDYLDDAYEFPSGRGLEFRTVEEPTVNARAWLLADQTRYGIEFTLGLIVWLDGIAVTLASHVAREFVPEDYPPLILESDDEDWRTIFQRRLDLSTQQLPEDHYGAWESFFQKAAIGIFAHEFSHIGRGHIDWQFARSGSAQIGERSLRHAKPVLQADEVRFLEFDADMFAGGLLAKLTVSPPTFLPRWRIGTSTETLVVTLIGLILLFVCIEKEEKDLGTRAPEYPRPLLRMIVISTYMSGIWSHANPGGDFWEKVYTNTLEVISLCESLYPEIDLLRGLLDKEELDLLRAEADALNDMLDTLQLDVVEYAFDGPGLWGPGEDVVH